MKGKDPLLEDLALVPRLAVTTAVAVPLMTLVVMPRATGLLRGWRIPMTADRPETGTEQQEFRRPRGGTQ